MYKFTDASEYLAAIKGVPNDEHIRLVVDCYLRYGYADSISKMALDDYFKKYPEEKENFYKQCIKEEI